jgi:hypothetical protein
MKIAILYHGLIDPYTESTHYFNTKNFYESITSYHDVDIYCHFWDNGKDEENKLYRLYKPNKLKIEKYEDKLIPFKKAILDYNQKNPQSKELISENIFSKFFFESDDQTSDYFWGKYLSLQSLYHTVGDLSEYDFVVKLHPYVILEKLTSHKWDIVFNRIENFTQEFNKNSIMNCYTQALAGGSITFDLLWICKPHAWANYVSNIQEHCLKLATEDRLCFLWHNKCLQNPVKVYPAKDHKYLTITDNCFVYNYCSMVTGTTFIGSNNTLFDDTISFVTRNFWEDGHKMDIHDIRERSVKHKW